VYTDKPKLFSKYNHELPVATELMTNEMIATYKGPLNFVHRVKICIMQDCFRKYNSDIFYLDSDTYFTKPPRSLFEKISPATSIRNSNDYDLTTADDLYENKDWLLIRKVIRSFDYIVEGKGIKIPLTTRMWNAGVIGMSYQNAGLLNNILNLCDQIYSNKKIFTAEQFAFSYYLQNKTELISSGDVIFHYWKYFQPYNWREIYKYHLHKFFKNYKNDSVSDQSTKAFQLTLEHGNLKIPKQKIRMRKVLNRLENIARVILKGKIKTHI
jgi:hypothetical protein